MAQALAHRFVAQRDRVFAYTKAQGILAEVQSFVDRGGFGETFDLDSQQAHQA